MNDSPFPWKTHPMTVNDLIRRLVAMREADPDVAHMRVAIGDASRDATTVQIKVTRVAPAVEDDYAIVIT